MTELSSNDEYRMAQAERKAGNNTYLTLTDLEKLVVPTGMRIELDRKDAIYWPGDMVKGKVVIETDKELKCKSINLSFTGRCRSCDGAGAGEPVQDLPGDKWLQEYRNTIRGNFYRSVGDRSRSAPQQCMRRDSDVRPPPLPPPARLSTALRSSRMLVTV